jgi:hypothetical protein
MRALFAISLFELLLGGGGHVTAAGPLTLRMVLFAGCLAATLISLFFPRRRADGVLFAMALVLAYLIIHVGGLLVGAINGGDTVAMFTQFQQSLFWLAAPFFALMIQTEKDVDSCARIVQIAGATLACAYLTILLALLTGLVNLGSVRSLLANSGEVVFRSGEFFIYKGFLYLGVAIIFFVGIRGKYWAPLALVTGLALVGTLTRGFLLSTSLSLLLMLVVQRRWRTVVPALVLSAAGAFFVWEYLPSLDTSQSEAQGTSSDHRIQDMTYLANHTTIKTLVIGEGYGSQINGRGMIENTFLWVLWCFGIVGLMFWTMPLALCVYYFSKIPDAYLHPVANAYMFGTVLVYLQTATNPYLNNPIGLSYVLLALFSLRVLSRTRSKNSIVGASLAHGTPALTSP